MSDPDWEEMFWRGVGAIGGRGEKWLVWVRCYLGEDEVLLWADVL